MSDFIHRAESFYRDERRFDGDEMVALPFVPAKFWHPPGVQFRVPTDGPGGVVVARVDHGRWIVDCPTPGCGGAQAACESDPRFYCHLCMNVTSGGMWLDVQWPSQEERGQIERLLLRRRDHTKRNWNPGETVAYLKADNLAHGDERLEG